MTVSADKGNSSINIRDVILSFDWRIRLFSELDNIVNKVSRFPMNIQTEIKQVADTLKSQCDDSDANDIPIKRRVNFLSPQLKLCCVISDNGRRHTAELMQTAIELMLC